MVYKKREDLEYSNIRALFRIFLIILLLIGIIFIIKIFLNPDLEKEKNISFLEIEKKNIEEVIPTIVILEENENLKLNIEFITKDDLRYVHLKDFNCNICNFYISVQEDKNLNSIEVFIDSQNMLKIPEELNLREYKYLRIYEGNNYLGYIVLV